MFQTSKGAWVSGVVLFILVITAFVAVNGLRPSHSTSMTATATLPPPTATLAPGICNAADFPTRTLSGPPTSSFNGPAVGFAYPPTTYFTHVTDADGTYLYWVCSAGNPISIFAFMQQSIPAGGWTITAKTATTLMAVQSNAPQEGLCSFVNIRVGTHGGYPGEWDAVFHSPTANCHP
jgi:hypothetical protein